MKKNFALFGIVLAFLIFTLIQSAYAADPPEISCFFVGRVVINDVPVPGKQVIAYLNGTTTIVGEGKNGSSEGIYSVVVTNADNQYVFFKVAGMLVDQDPQLCSGGAFPPIELNLTVTDSDNDGYSQKEDCNDDDNTIYPGAPEICDDLDNDCDGAIDNGVYYCDVDKDGYYSKIQTNCIPSEVDCITTPGNDCNDNNKNIHPGAVDLCDGIDNNCDGIDNGCGGGTGGGGSSGGGGGASSGYCGDNIVQKSRGEECEKNSDCQIGFVCDSSCKCVVCVENWLCTEWSECSPQGIQTRVCTDTNGCGTTNNKPSESQTCVYGGGGASTVIPLSSIICGNGNCEEGETCDNCPEDCGACITGGESATGALGLFTGMITSLPGAAGLGLLILLLLALLLLMTRKRKRKEEE